MVFIDPARCYRGNSDMLSSVIALPSASIGNVNEDVMFTFALIVYIDKNSYSNFKRLIVYC